MPTFSSMAFFNFSFTSACVLPRTFLIMALPVSGSRPTVYRPSQRPSLRFRMFPSPFARLFGIKSASFANEQYRKQVDKATGKRNSYQKVIICFASLFSLPIAAQFLRCRGTFSLVSAVRFWNGQGVLSIDYSGSKYARFTPKIAAVLKSLF